MKKHWAAKFIGRPWTPENNCWALVRDVFASRYGIVMPIVYVSQFGSLENVAAITKAAQASGWRRAPDTVPQDGDIVLMRTSSMARHVGVMIDTSSGLRLLHSDGFMTVHGPVGSVAAQPMRDVLAEGFHEVELWRKA